MIENLAVFALVYLGWLACMALVIYCSRIIAIIVAVLSGDKELIGEIGNLCDDDPAGHGKQRQGQQHWYDHWNEPPKK